MGLALLRFQVVGCWLGAKRGVGAFIGFGLWTLHLLSDWIAGLECAAAAH